jgi:hypothetical protein
MCATASVGTVTSKVADVRVQRAIADALLGHLAAQRDGRDAELAQQIRSGVS